MNKFGDERKVRYVNRIQGTSKLNKIYQYYSFFCYFCVKTIFFWAILRELLNFFQDVICLKVRALLESELMAAN